MVWMSTSIPDILSMRFCQVLFELLSSKVPHTTKPRMILRSMIVLSPPIPSRADFYKPRALFPIAPNQLFVMLKLGNELNALPRPICFMASLLRLMMEMKQRKRLLLPYAKYCALYTIDSDISYSDTSASTAAFPANIVMSCVQGSTTTTTPNRNVASSLRVSESLWTFDMYGERCHHLVHRRGRLSAMSIMQVD
jgi:hypothetical protein